MGDTMSAPLGEERIVKQKSGAEIDGSPITYIVVLAAVIMVLALVPIPISIVIGSGKNFPISQGIYPLMGWLLGPIAGAITNAVGALGGVIIAPHTTTSRLGTIIGAALGGFAAGVMGKKEQREWWWIPVSALNIIFLILYAGRAIFVNHANWLHVVLGTFIDWSALLLFLLPSRSYFARCLQDEKMTSVSIGLFGGTWIISGLTHLCTGMFVYSIINWPSESWLLFAPLAPLEHAIRCLVGMVIGTGVIAGLRAIGLSKPTQGLY
jgi:hypothetical protein